MEQRTAEYIRTNRLLSPGDRVICALSGGCDSRQDSCYNSRPYLKPEPDFRQAVNSNGQLIIIQKRESFAKGRRAGSIREDAA